MVLFLQCVGVVGRLLFSSMESESGIFEYLLFERGFEESVAQSIDNLGAYGCLAAAILFVFSLLFQQPGRPLNPGYDRPALRWIEITAAVFVSAWSIANALCHTLRGGIFSQLTLGEVAVRIICPLVLVLLLQSASRNVTRASSFAKWLLTVAVSTTFVVHGYKAILLHGPFTDLILLSDARVFHFGWEQETVEVMLLVIGWLDVVVAVALLFTRWRVIAFYMLFWGLVTASSRVTALGWPAWPEMIVRAANWGGPLVLLMMWRWENRKVE